MKKGLGLLVACLVVLSMLAAACAPAAPAPTPKTLFEVKGAGPTPLFGFIATQGPTMADLLGYLEEEGIKMAWTEFAGGADQVRAVTTGGYHIGVVSTSAPIAAFDKGEPVVIIGGGASGNLSGYLVKADSPIKTIQDLKGKKVGYSRPSSTSHMIAIKVLKAVGLNPDKDLTLVPVGGLADSWTAVKGGVVDAGWSTEPLQTQVARSGEGRVLFYNYEYVKDWEEVTIITNRAFAKERPDVLRAFLKAQQRANEFILKDREKAAKTWAPKSGVDEAVATEMLKKVPASFFTVQMNPKAFYDLEEFMLEVKQIDKKVAWNELVDQSFLPEQLRSKF